MSTTLPPVSLPPSGRDFFVYERVVIELASTRQVAAEANISQTRVRQIIGKVLDWLAESLLAKANLTDEAQLRVARHIAADRLEDLYRSANKKWLATEECKYGNLAIRVIQAKSKLPAVAGHYAALMATALESPGSGVICANDASLEKSSPQLTPDPLGAKNHVGEPQPAAPAQPRRQRQVPSNPPPGDCSPAPIASPKATATNRDDSTPTPVTKPSSDNLTPSAHAARRAFLHTAHPALDDQDSSPADAITELKLSPNTVGATAGLSSSAFQRPLTRQQRRRLNRLKTK